MCDNHPNLLWIITDHLRYQALSGNGNLNVDTPNIDRLAQEGVACDYAISQYPVCTPFRAGLVTGQYNHINGVRVHGDLLPPDRRTIAHAFRDAGYRTSWVGKWHLAGVNGVAGWSAGEDYWVHPFLRGGFEDWFGFDVSNNSSEYFDEEFYQKISDEFAFFCKNFEVNQIDILRDSFHLKTNYLLTIIEILECLKE